MEAGTEQTDAHRCRQQVAFHQITHPVVRTVATGICPILCPHRILICAWPERGSHVLNGICLQATREARKADSWKTAYNLVPPPSVYCERLLDERDPNLPFQREEGIVGFSACTRVTRGH